MAVAAISVTMRVRRCGRRNEEGGEDFAAGTTWELQVKEPGPRSLSIGVNVVRSNRRSASSLVPARKSSSWSVEIAGLMVTCCQRCHLHHRCLDHSLG